jgi:hypothetical protein
MFFPQKRLALIFQRGGDWSLVETIQRQKILCGRRRSGALVEIHECAIRRERFRMSLLLVELLKDLSGLDQLGDGFAFALR